MVRALLFTITLNLLLMNYFTRMKGLWLVASLMLLTGVLYAQDQTVSGTVSSDAEGPLPGVNVLLKGTSTGTVTDLDGNYRLNVPEGVDTIVFSSIGYANQEIAISGRSTIDVVLGEDIQSLSEVVVIGYGTQEARDVTGAVNSISSEDFNQGVIASPEQLIQGRSPGVQITSASGEPGSGINIRIRGTSSVRGGNNPLFVVDGVPLAGDAISGSGQDVGFGTSSARNPLNFLNPNDIASIDILKDASATAIYGSRGANGVVLITTKSGQGTDGTLDYSFNAGLGRITQKYDLLGREQFLSAYAELNGADAAAELDQGADTDWQDQIFRTALTQNHNLSYGSGGETGNYRFSLGYTDQEGIVEESGLRRLSARFNGTKNFLDDRFSVSTQLTISDIRDDNVPISNTAGATGDLLGATLRLNPTFPVRDEDGNPFQLGVDFANPAAFLEYSEDYTNTVRALGNVTFELNIAEGFDFRTVLGADRSSSSRRQAYSGDLLVQGIETQGRAAFNDITSINTLMENYFTYEGQLSDNVKIDAVLGYSYQRFQTQTSTFQAAGFLSRDLDIILNNIAAVDLTLTVDEENGNITRNGGIVANSTNRVDELQSVFGRVTFDIADKYLITGTLRTDGSTRFGENFRYGYFPSFALGWRLSEEAFVPEAFTDLKLRAGYGVTGNQEFESNRYTFRQRYQDESLGSSPTGIVVNPGNLVDIAFPNRDLKWESTTQINVGVDYGLFNNRLRGSLDYYRKSTEDLLFLVELAQPSAQPFIFRNLDANVINEGVEIGIDADIVDNDDFGWSLAANAGFNDNRVENLATSVRTGAISGQGLSGAYAQRIAEGQPLFAYFLRPFAGYNEEGESLYGEEGSLDAPQQFVGKSPLPTTNLGLTNNFYYGNFDLTIFFSGQLGQYVYNNTANAFFTIGSLAGGKNVTEDVLGTGEGAINTPEVSTRFLENASFVRLQNLTIGYNVPTDGINFLSNLRLYVTGQNLLTFTEYSGQDPEVNVDKQIDGVPSFGIDYTAYPVARTYLFGLNVSF